MPKNSPIDILFLSHQYNILGGGEKALLETIIYTKSKGLRVHVILGDRGTFSETLDNLNIPYSIVFLPHWAHGGEDPSPFHFTSLNPAVNTTLQIYKLIHDLKPKLCITNTIVVPWLGYAASLTGTQHAWMIHELGTAGLNLRYAIGEDQTLRNLVALSDIILFNSKYTASYYQQWLPADMPQAIVYPGGTPPKPVRISNPFRPESVKLIAVAQIRPQKGQFDAVKAVHLLKEAGADPHLILIGLLENKEYCDAMDSYITQNNLTENITFLGHQTNPSSYVAHADIAIVTSANDSFGRVTVESMMLGKPTIAANSAGSTEIISDGIDGILYEPGNEHDLASKIIRLIQSPDLAKLIAEKGRQSTRKRFGEKHRFDELMQHFSSLPRKKTALDLTLLGSSFEDFAHTANLLESERARLETLHSSAAYKVARALTQVPSAIRRTLRTLHNRSS